ncbi:protein C1orf43 homolog [Petromyzon marinus]|uniref:protein C1orf43 homolog n=1 Tax=Petromyzon marinus TaxID=7757 RepID=UPI003F709527
MAGNSSSQEGQRFRIAGVNAVLVIAYGALVFVLLFIFAKRQIMRFTMRSHRGPHVAVGHNAPKDLREEIERRLSRIQELSWAPKFLTESDPRLQQLQELGPNCGYNYLYRMKALDAVDQLDERLQELEPLMRCHARNLRVHLLDLLRTHPGELTVCDSTVHAFADAYDHARYGTQEFGEVEFEKYMDLLNELMNGVQSQAIAQQQQHRAAARELGFPGGGGGGGGSSTSGDTNSPPSDGRHGTSGPRGAAGNSTSSPASPTSPSSSTCTANAPSSSSSSAAAAAASATSAAAATVQVTYLPAAGPRTRRPKHFLELKGKDSYRTLESTM